MSDLIQELSDLDQALLAQLQETEINSEEIQRLVDTREQILQNIIRDKKSDPSFKGSPEWQAALSRTQKIVGLMQKSTIQIGEQLRKYRHGSKSVKRYQQFL